MSNQSTIEHLNSLIAGERVERYHAPWCNLCHEIVITEDAKAKANAIKAQAAKIIVKLIEPGAGTDAWADLLKGTPFDNFDARVCRGEVSRYLPDGGDSHSNVKALLAMMISGGNLGGPEPPAPSPEEIEADKQRHRDYWTEYERRTPELFTTTQPKHHTECPNQP